MKKAIRTILNLLLALVFLFSIGKYLGHRQDKAAGSETYADALSLACLCFSLHEAFQRT